MQQSDRRRSERIAQEIPVTLHIVFRGGVESWWGRMVDHSQVGFKVRTQSALTPGYTLEVVSREGQFRPMRCRIVWVRFGSGDLPVEAGLEIIPSDAPMVNWDTANHEYISALKFAEGANNAIRENDVKYTRVLGQRFPRSGRSFAWVRVVK
jgi:hypothetical protein